MVKQPRGFMAFRTRRDAERYRGLKDEDAQAVRALFDRGRVVYMTEIARFSVTKEFPGRPYVKIANEDIPFPLYMSAATAKSFRPKDANAKTYLKKS